MSFWKKLFGGSQTTEPQASSPRIKTAVPAATKPQAASGYKERDNVGTRYESREDVKGYAMSFQAQGLESPYIRYYFYEKNDALAAILEVPCIKVASDTGKFISTEPIDFGMYPTLASDGSGRVATWSVFLAGRHVSQEIFDIAVAACKKRKGEEAKVSGRPAQAPSSKATSTVSSSSATFVREEHSSIEGRSLSKKIYSAPSKAAALAFLQKQAISKPFTYVEVDTPEGRFGKDMDGIYG